MPRGLGSSPALERSMNGVESGSEVTNQPMICEVCRESVATVHLTEIVNNSKKEIHLCETCAQDKGVALQSQIKNLSIPEFFGPLAEAKESPADQEELVCRDCGLSYRNFRTTGKLGCPSCYTVFGSDLTQLLEKIHQGTIQHRGKVPHRVDREITRRKEIEELRTELRQAVEHEKYELAASLRDRIHSLERGAS